MRGLVVLAAAVALCACDLPLGLGGAATADVESGAASTLSGARSFEISGEYMESSTPTSLDLQLSRPDTEHLVVTNASVKLEAIVIGSDAYFRGQQFLARSVGSDPVAQGLVRSAGDGWWKGGSGAVPRLPDFTDGRAFRAAFLGSAVSRRTDGVVAYGVPAIEMSGPRADVYLEAADPHAVIRVRLRPGVVVDGLRQADFHYGAYGRNFGLRAPANVIDFSNLSRAAPIYTVVSVDASSCASPCAVTANLKNLGGTGAARGRSTVSFTL